MAIKKSELYSTLWKGCDELRGGMDASQYKDYVLALLFVKYISDKYAGDPDALIEVPEGASFKDMVALKDTKDIGDGINKILGKIAEVNDLKGVIDVADFNDSSKLGVGKAMVDTLSKLIAVFQNSNLDFSKNHAHGDDILGDAYEYLMKHFATESGKSKGQFYTPAEVSRVMAKVIGLDKNTPVSATIYDPTCGSGSLLLKANDETARGIGIYGQEKDVATAGLAKMNMILHGVETAEINQGDTISNPKFKDENGQLRTFDFVVANPPFSTKSWSSGLDINQDIYGRWGTAIGIPPEKNGDYAFLLHIVSSLKSSGKGACILPHGVLFRGNAEADIRKYLLTKGYIKGLIGLPANLFFGTGIPACIIILDKEGAANRQEVFMIDAKNSFAKEGNKNRLREQDVRKIVDVWHAQQDEAKFARRVPISEIRANDYNLNLPRYIDSQEAEDMQDIEAHLLGGIPNADIDALHRYWEACPSLRNDLFKENLRTGFSDLNVAKSEVRDAIYHNADFIKQRDLVTKLFGDWKNRHHDTLYHLEIGFSPKSEIQNLSNSLINVFQTETFVDPYDVYECLMGYWTEAMQDDFYQIEQDGWKLQLYAPNEKKPNDLVCDLLPFDIVTSVYFEEEQNGITAIEENLERIAGRKTELLEEYADSLLNPEDYPDEKVNKANVAKRIKEKRDLKEELAILKEFVGLFDSESGLKRQLKDAQAALYALLLQKYAVLNQDEEEVKRLVIEHKWMPAISKAIHAQMQQISQHLTARVVELAERYEETLPSLDNQERELEECVLAHLAQMGFKC